MGSAGVVALPMSKLFKQYGADAMSYALVLTSLFQVLFGYMKVGENADIVTESVNVGFMNALGIFIAKNQISSFRSYGLSSISLLPSLSMAILTIILIQSFTNMPNLASKVPPPLLAIICVTLLSKALRLPLRTLSCLTQGSRGILGSFNFLPHLAALKSIVWSKGKIYAVVSTAFAAAIVSIIATIITHDVIQNLHKSKVSSTKSKVSNLETRDDPQKEAGYDKNRLMVGMGIANLVAASIGSFGGCGLIPNTMLNLKNGGISSISTYAYGITMASFGCILSPLLNAIPMAALNGLMLIVAWNVIEWKRSKKIVIESKQSIQKKFDLFSMITTTYLSVKVDMGIGILAGMLISKLPSLFKSEKMKNFVNNVSQN